MERPVGSWGSRSQAARVSWQLMKASEQLSAHHWLVQHQNLQSICLSGMALNRAVARLGRGLGAQGNRSSRSASRGDFPRLLPPTQRLPPCSGDGSGPSRQVLIAAQLSPRLGAPVWGTQTRAGPRKDKGSLAVAQVPSRQTSYVSSWMGLIRLRAEASGTAEERIKC